MKFVLLFIIIINIFCSSSYLILDDVDDALNMGYKVTAVDTLEDGLFRVWIREH